jgi:PAS domain S-box-containing protein
MMLQQLSEQIRLCHAHAAEARRQAEEAADPALRASLLDVERHWLFLARSYAFAESLGDFTSGGAFRNRELRSAAPAGAAPDTASQLHEISTLLIQEGNIEALYERVIDAAIGLMSSDMASMQMLDPKRGELRLLAWRGFHPKSAAFWEWVHVDSGSTCGAAFSQGRRVVVPDVETCDFMAGTADLDHYRLSGIRAVQSTPLISRSGRLLGMISTHWREPHQPDERALRQLDVLARQAADLIERTQAEVALRSSEEQSRWLAAVIESSDDAIVSKNLEGIIRSWNAGAERIFGYTAEEAIGQSILLLIPPERHEEEDLILSRLRSGQRIDHFETVRRRKDGTYVDVSLTISPVKDANGTIVGASKIARDITEQKRSQAQIAILAREAEHRAKNILATVQATVRLSHAETAEGLKQAIEGRVRALANVHNLFSQSHWAGADLRRIIAQELTPYCEADTERAQLEGPEVMLPSEKAQPIAVSVHELATNAAKYGALSVADGRLAVRWSRAPDGKLVIRWSETGGPPVKPPARRGFGTRVMETLIRNQLKGKLHFDWNPDGVACEIMIPA